MPKIPRFLHPTLARQLGGPSGPLGTLIARMLNKGNRSAIEAAVAALELTGSETVADIGFGGGIGLDLLLAAAPDGAVHGVDPATDMVARARRSHAGAFAEGRLQLHEATMQALPLGDGSLDGWISVNTIYFIEGDLGPAFRELARVLAPTGRGVLGIADPDWMAQQPVTQHGFTLRPVAEVVAALEAAGLAVDERRLGGDRRAFRLLVCRPA